jgi:hypothetical protein
MVFVYYILAKIEERECSKKFGEPYIEYKNKTNMFLPFKVKLFANIQLPKSNRKKAFVLLSVYAIVLLLVLGIANRLEYLSIKSLYSVYTNNSANISVCKMSDEEINNILQILRSEKETNTYFSGFDERIQYINYILPVEWFAAEIPMNGVETGKGHNSPKNYDKNLYKVIITEVIFINNDRISSIELLKNIYARRAIIEIWVDLSKGKVIKILEMPEKLKYEGIPVAVY